jgi:hypothetical protein
MLAKLGEGARAAEEPEGGAIFERIASAYLEAWKREENEQSLVEREWLGDSRCKQASEKRGN